MDIRDISIDDTKDSKKLISKFASTGFQASKLWYATKLVNKMKKEKAKIYLTFTANMVASGLRGLFAELCKKKYIDVIITTAGALEHDFMRACFDSKYKLGEFTTDDIKLHAHGINRIGNILVSNKNYIYFEKEIISIFEKLWIKKRIISPSKLCYEMGASLTSRKSFLYWCTKNKIPIFCPGITDGAIGLQAYFFKQRRKDFGIDVTKDMDALASITLNAEKTGGIILGGGISKHHAIGVNLLRGGFDYAVYITTAQPWDGSLSGARTNEAISWGKINKNAEHVTIDAEATIAFPMLVAGLKL
ncbi:MAG: deoxyhypusine synthase [Candidatus Micrarchaeota archaeon]